MVTAAHHDDIEFGAAGSVARWIRDESASVTYVIITDGGSGSNEPTLSRAELVALRREEQIKAAAIVGVHDVRFLDYPDGTLQASLALRRDLTRIIRETKPYRVVCQDPTTVFVLSRYINHPDHRAAGEATLYAAFPSAETRPIFPELLAEGLRAAQDRRALSELDARGDALRRHQQTPVQLKMAALGGARLADRRRRRLRERRQEVGNGDQWPGRQSCVGVEYAEYFRVMKFDEPRTSIVDEDVSVRARRAEQQWVRGNGPIGVICQDLHVMRIGN